MPRDAHYNRPASVAWMLCKTSRTKRATIVKPWAFVSYEFFPPASSQGLRLLRASVRSCGHLASSRGTRSIAACVYILGHAHLCDTSNKVIH